MPIFSSPYNFISLDTPVSVKKESIPAQNLISEKVDSEALYSGSMSYTVTAKTNIFVGGADANTFYKTLNGDYAIPGSSIRGLIRNNMQILGLGSIASDVDDYKLMYRKVGAISNSTITNDYKDILGVTTIKKGKNSISICKNVQAGFLYFDGKDYYIIESDHGALDNEHGKQNYYILRETDIIKELQKHDESETDYPYSYLNDIKDHHIMYITDKGFPFETTRKGLQSKSGYENPNFRPSFYDISFKVGPNNEVIDVKKSNKLKGKDCYEGIIICSGFMNNKKAHYIIPKSTDLLTDDHSDTSKYIKMPELDVTAYKKDYEAKKNLIGKTLRLKGLTLDEKKEIYAECRKFYELPQKKGEIKPVFYICLNDGNYHFGFTPYLRLFFEHTIAYGIPKGHKSIDIDYTKAILGYSNRTKNGNDSRKSRVSFEDAIIKLDKNDKSSKHVLEEVKETLASPKATSFLDYIKQESKSDPANHITYNSPNFEIRGFKQYWLHRNVIKSNSNGNDKMQSGFKPLSANTKFKGTIHFKNLKADELGLLLWCFRLEENCEQNIGKAKALGYGRISINIDELNLLDYKKMYDSLELNFAPYIENKVDIKEEVDSYINTFKKEISSKLPNGKDIMKLNSIKRFLIMKSEIPSEDKTAYSDIKKYKNRKDTLPFPEEVCERASFTPFSEKKIKPSAIAKKPEVRKPQIFVDAKVNGTIKSIAKRKNGSICGFNINLPENKVGMLHESKITKPISEYKVGDTVYVQVLTLDNKNGKLNIQLLEI